MHRHNSAARHEVQTNQMLLNWNLSLSNDNFKLVIKIVVGVDDDMHVVVACCYLF